MIGIIVTGHGGFAAGMAANVKMLAGEEAEVTAVDFADGLTPEALEQKLAAAMDACAGCAFTVVLADIAGGTPYNRAATLSVGRPKVRVLSGANSSMLMELAMHNVTDDDIEDVDALCEELMATGRENIGKFVLEAVDEAPEDGDGI